MGPWKSKPQKQQYTVTLFDYNHLAHVIVLKQISKFMSYCTVFALLYFEYEGYFPSISPGAGIWRGYLSEDLLFFEFGGGGGVYSEGSIHRGACFRNFTIFV